MNSNVAFFISSPPGGKVLLDSVTERKTAELAIEQTRMLLRSIDTSHVVGLRDRAVLGVLAYTGRRIAAVARLDCRLPESR